jgi:hypothetical protein
VSGVQRRPRPCLRHHGPGRPHLVHRAERPRRGRPRQRRRQCDRAHRRGDSGLHEGCAPSRDHHGPDGHIWFTEQSGRVGQRRRDRERARGRSDARLANSAVRTSSPGPIASWFTEQQQRAAGAGSTTTAPCRVHGRRDADSASAGPTGITSGPTTGGSDSPSTTAAVSGGSPSAPPSHRMRPPTPTPTPRGCTAPYARTRSRPSSTSNTVRPGLRLRTVHRRRDKDGGTVGLGGAHRPEAAPSTTTGSWRRATPTPQSARRTFTTRHAAAAAGATDHEGPSSRRRLRGRFASGTLRLDWGAATDNTGVVTTACTATASSASRPGELEAATVRGFRTPRHRGVRRGVRRNRQRVLSSITVNPRRRPQSADPDPGGRPGCSPSRPLGGRRRRRRPRGSRLVPRWKTWRLDPYRPRRSLTAVHSSDGDRPGLRAACDSAGRRPPRDSAEHVPRRQAGRGRSARDDWVGRWRRGGVESRA